MAGKVYLTEEEYNERIVKDNETIKAISALCGQFGTALITGGAVQVYTKGWADDPNVIWWFLLAIGLILAGVGAMRLLKAEA